MREASRQEVQERVNLPITTAFCHFISLVQKLCLADFFQSLLQIRQKQELQKPTVIPVFVGCMKKYTLM